MHFISLPKVLIIVLLVSSTLLLISMARGKFHGVPEAGSTLRTINISCGLWTHPTQLFPVTWAYMEDLYLAP